MGHSHHPSGLDPTSAGAAEEVLRGLAADLHRIDPHAAWQRLQTLTEEQRAWVVSEVDGWGAGPPS